MSEISRNFKDFQISVEINQNIGIFCQMCFKGLF